MARWIWIRGVCCEHQTVLVVKSQTDHSSVELLFLLCLPNRQRRLVQLVRERHSNKPLIMYRQRLHEYAHSPCSDNLDAVVHLLAIQQLLVWLGFS
jgi:hypothetical protein